MTAFCEDGSLSSCGICVGSCGIEEAEEAAAKRAWVERVNAALPPYIRQRRRDATEARLLRERGTPEHLIGPEERDG